MTAEKPRNIGADKKHFLRCRRFWLRALPLALVTIISLLLVIAFSVLRFGNVRWNKWIYIFQAYVSPGYVYGLIDPPAVYTGVWTRWHPNGRKSGKRNYRNGLLEGKCIYWHPNGQKMGEGNFKDDHLRGKWTTWYANGQKQSEGYYRNGKKEGKWIWWHENGQREREENYRNGKEDGKWKFWNENGSIIRIEHYNNGTLIRTEKPK